MKLDIATLAVLLAFVLWGSRRGLVKTAFSLVSMAASLAAGYLLFRPVSAALARLNVADAIAKKLSESDMLASLPGVMRDLPIASAAADGLFGAVAQAAVDVLGFMAVVVVVKLLLFIISATLGIASSLPVVRQANGLAGGALGFALGAVFVLVVFACLGALEAFGKINVMSGLLQGSRFASLLYNNNPLMESILKLA